jgi:CDP-glycerol glycerophosphotransferase
VKIVWSCFRGLFADNPRAIYDALVARGPRPDLTHTWLCTEATRSSFPAEVATAVYRTPESVAALEEADLVIANDCISMPWTKRPGAVYLQTWHGTPIKKIHHDIQPVREGWLDGATRDIARWDHLISPNPVSTARLRSAFRYQGPLHETGYPRNDVLSSPDRDAVRARTRAELGIPDGTTAVLYAPTWRDDLVFDSDGPGFELPIDLAAFADRLGGDHVLLVRLHSIVSGRLSLDPALPVRDVSDMPDSAALYLAADVLVTDYSSAMCDFAVTGKPQIFYTYDLEHYRDDLRGFYFDLAAAAPGPLVRTSPELLEAIAHVDAQAAEYADRYARFRETFCSLEDGAASARVLDLLTGVLAPATAPTTEEAQPRADH